MYYEGINCVAFHIVFNQCCSYRFVSCILFSFHRSVYRMLKLQCPQSWKLTHSRCCNWMGYFVNRLLPLSICYLLYGQSIFCSVWRDLKENERLYILFQNKETRLTSQLWSNSNLKSYYGPVNYKPLLKGPSVSFKYYLDTRPSLLTPIIFFLVIRFARPREFGLSNQCLFVFNCISPYIIVFNTDLPLISIPSPMVAFLYHLDSSCCIINK